MKPESALHAAPVGVLYSLMEQTAGFVGQDFFRQLVRSLAAGLDTEYAFVTLRVPEDPKRLKLIAGWHVNHAAGALGEIDIPGTPAERVMAEGRLWIEDEAATAFPEDRWLRKHGVRANCAVAASTRCSGSPPRSSPPPSVPRPASSPSRNWRPASSPISMPRWNACSGSARPRSSAAAPWNSGCGNTRTSARSTCR